MIPDEVEYREVAHDFEDEAWDPVVLLTGTIKDREWWGSKGQHLAEMKDLRRKERARAALGGFGFQPPGAAT